MCISMDAGWVIFSLLANFDVLLNATKRSRTLTLIFFIPFFVLLKKLRKNYGTNMVEYTDM